VVLDRRRRHLPLMPDAVPEEAGEAAGEEREPQRDTV